MEGDWHFKFQASIQYIIMLVLLHFHFYLCNSVNNAGFEDILLDTFYFSCPCDGFLGRLVLKAAYFHGSELCDARTGARISPKQGTLQRAAVAQKIFLLLRWNVEIRGGRPGPD